MSRICFVATTPLSVNPFLLEHLRRLSDKYQVTLCVNLELHELSDKIDPRIAVVNIKILRRIRPLSDITALLSLIYVFRKEKFDSVHSITPKAGLLAMLAGWLCRIPHRIHTFTGQIWANKSGIERAFLKLVDRVIVGCATRVLSDSPSQSELLQKELRLKNAVGVLGKGSIAGVNQKRFRRSTKIRSEIRTSLAVPRRCFVFLYVGRLALDKGLFDLVSAFKRLHSINSNVRLWVVGNDEEGLLDSLKLASGNAIDAIQWIKYSSTPEKYMMSADALVLPSHREGFGLVVIEAAACGIPAIAYRICGVVDSVDENNTGILVNLHDTDGFTNGMLALANDRAKSRKMGKQAQQRVNQFYSSEMIGRAWIDFYVTHVRTPGSH